MLERHVADRDVSAFRRSSGLATMAHGRFTVDWRRCATSTNFCLLSKSRETCERGAANSAAYLWFFSARHTREAMLQPSPASCRPMSHTHTWASSALLRPLHGHIRFCLPSSHVTQAHYKCGMAVQDFQPRITCSGCQRLFDGKLDTCATG
jgi:hypothetical protein